MPQTANSSVQPLQAQPATVGIPNGPAVAVCMAAVIGMLAMALAVIASDASAGFKAGMISLGRVLPVVGPGANGPYAGHETVLLIVWLGSWLLLHALWRRRQFEGSGWLAATLIGIGISTILLWPPLRELMLGKR